MDHDLSAIHDRLDIIMSTLDRDEPLCAEVKKLLGIDGSAQTPDDPLLSERDVIREAARSIATAEVKSGCYYRLEDLWSAFQLHQLIDTATQNHHKRAGAGITN